MESFSNNDDPSCIWCSALLSEPYIQCEACPSISGRNKVHLCLHCFAKGVEVEGHQSDHPYSVVKNNFPVFESSWTAQEEKQLLEAVMDCGYGNWVDIAHKIRNKTPTDCEHHYNHYYVNKPCPDLPGFSEANLSYYPQPVVYKLSEDPPRPADGSQVITEMAGYMAGRGDFTTEHDNYMELDLQHLEFNQDDDDLDQELKLAVVDVYQRCLAERWRRKRVVQRHGLIDMCKTTKLRNRFERLLGPVVDRLRVFTQIVQPDSYSMYLESLYYEKELQHDIINLQNYRRNGLKKLRHIKMYRTLKKNRDKAKGDRSLLNEVISHVKDETACQTWLHRQATLDCLGKGSPLNLPNAPRKSAPPLDIAELPGYERLNSRERELCSTIRLVPIAYSEFKNQLVTECKKQGYLKLAQARLLIKIDVNKTRKIYDFLVAEGILNKD